MLYEKYYEKAEQFCRDNRENLIADIRRLVEIPSVQGKPEPEKPFGPGPAAALAEVLEIAGKMGLSTYNCNNYMGWAEIRGSSGKQLATITHVDVVPAGNGWNGDPFRMREQDGWIIGRGVIDDKGPAICCLYLLKFLKENHVPLKYTVRALMGVNEETGMEDVSYYLNHYKAPDFCISVDAMFPVCNGEKGSLKGSVVSKKLHGNLLEFHGGIAPNVIPDYATCLIRADPGKLTYFPGITWKKEDDAIRIYGRGKGGHAFRPSGTVNAISLVIKYLLHNHLCNPEETKFLTFLDRMHSATDGSGLGIATSDDIFDPLTITGAMITMENGQIHQQFDCRYPTSITAGEIIDKMKTISDGCIDFEEIHINKPFYCSDDMPAIQALMKTYNEVTGHQASPFTMGGGTYARHFPVAVNFGPEYLDTILPDFAGPYHGANEGAEIQTLIDGLKMYILSVLRIQDISL